MLFTVKDDGKGLGQEIQDVTSIKSMATSPV